MAQMHHDAMATNVMLGGCVWDHVPQISSRHATISSDQYSASSHSQARSKDGSAACSSSSALQQPMHLTAPQLVGIRLPGLHQLAWQLRAP